LFILDDEGSFGRLLLRETWSESYSLSFWMLLHYG